MCAFGSRPLTKGTLLLISKRHVTAIVAFVTVAGVAGAVEQYGTVFGGSGGTEFEQVCNTGSVSGIRVRSASRVDAIGTRCYRDTPVNSGLHGGGGGSLASSDCPGSTPFAKGIRGRAAAEIDRIGLYCTDAAKISATAMQEFGGNGGSAFSYTCASGFSVKGFQGKSGARVDRIGAICSNRAETSSAL
jgi:hypothetical protein